MTDGAPNNQSPLCEERVRGRFFCLLFIEFINQNYRITCDETNLPSGV